jgi:uncharacterized protein YbjT (DUF2867 family)
MKILLLGAAGFLGRAAAALLARRDDVGELILADYDIRDAKRLAKSLSPKCRWAMADAGKPPELSRLLEGIDAAACAVGPFAEYGPAVMRTCASRGVPAAVIGEGAVPEEARKGIDRAFRDAGLPAAAGCGLMPGWTDLLAAHFLGAGGPDESLPQEKYLFFSPARFGGYAFLREVAKGITADAPAPMGAPAGRYFAMPDGSRVGVPGGKAGTRLGRVVGAARKLGAVGKEFSAALLLWTRAGLPEPAGAPLAAAGVARGGRFARVEDPKGNLAAALLAATAVRLAARPGGSTGLLRLADLFGRREAEALAAACGGRIVTG